MDEQRQQNLEQRVQKLDAALAGLPAEQRQTILGPVAQLQSALADLPDEPREATLGAVRGLLNAWAPLNQRLPSAASIPKAEELRWVANRLRRLATERT
jgi:hypothetical protein